MTHDYKRHGTTTLFAALNVLEGTVIGLLPRTPSSSGVSEILDVPLMLPKAGVFAHAQALVVARRIAAEIAGNTPADQFQGEGFCMLEAGADEPASPSETSSPSHPRVCMRAASVVRRFSDCRLAIGHRHQLCNVRI